MKNILFLVTGMSPQIITETIWALACNPKKNPQWIPDEVYVLTTQIGINQIKERLFNKGVFDNLKKDYPQLRNIKFDSSSLIGVEVDGEVLDDIKTPEHNEAMADTLCELVRGLTESTDTTLHVSIAGGRKTMGFYAGYALSLYGRPQDRLSHVLITEQFEQAINFFYPTPYSYLVSKKNEVVIGDASNAEVWLSEIPFVRMRSLLDKESILSNKGFSEIVETIDKSLKPIELKIVNNDERKIFVGKDFCKLSPKEFSLYLVAAELRLLGETLRYPSKDIDGDTIDSKHMKRFNEVYDQHKSINVVDEIIVDYDYFSNTLSTIKRKFKKAFGPKLAEKIAIQKDVESGGFGILLPAQNVIVIT